ncbi:MAG: radical SAM protein [Anaerolineales bacterium]
MNYAPTSLKKVYIEPVQGACNRRQLDAERVASFFVNNDFYLVANPKEADVIFLVTCAVSTKREDGSISRINHLKKYGGELMVGGCLPAINEKRMLSVFNGRSISTSELPKIDNYFPETKIKFSELEDANHYFPSYSKIFSREFAEIAWNKFLSLRMLSPNYIVTKEIPRIFGLLTRKNSLQTTPYPVRISWGCNQKCSYCGVRAAVSRLHSKPLEICRQEFLEGVEKGYQEFEIIADDVGAYGIDIGKNFPDLLSELFEIPGEYRVLIWNLSPMWLVHNQEKFLPILQKQRIYRIHFPVQSGSQNILKAMNRYINVQKTVESLLFLRKHSPGLILTTDVIIGFPGETEVDVDETIEFIRKVHFNGANIFMYYSVPNTPAHSLENHVPQKVMEKRVRRVRDALERMDMDYTIS